ncbi:MAG: HEAT repeat domain-containing protein [Planctomycetes bacterium]|nr:HEAT repeat domain-containing protein [Planctomycetota bacterium]
MSKRPLLVLSLLACLAASAIALFQSGAAVPAPVELLSDDSGRPGARAPELAGDDPQTSRQEAARRPYELVAGERLQLATRWRTQVETRRGDSAPSQKLVVEIAGPLELTVLDRRGDRFAIAFRMGEADVQVSVDERCSDSTTIRRDLAAGAVALLSTEGAVAGFRFPAELDPRDRNLLRGLFLASRVQLGPVAAADWTVVEPDAIGEATIAMRREAGPRGDDVITWNKTSYAMRANDLLPAVDGSGRLAADGHRAWWSRVESTERASARVEALDLDVVAQTGARFELTGVDRIGGVPSFDWEAAWSPTGGWREGAAAAESAEHEHWVAELRGTSLRMEFARLAALLAGPDEADRDQALHELRERITWLIRLDSQTVEELAKLLAQPELDPFLAAVLASAAGSAGTAEAQRMLADLVLHRELAPQRRLAGLRAMFDLSSPSPTVLDAVHALLGDGSEDAAMSGTGMLLLGAFARLDRGSQAGPDRLPGLLALEQSAAATGRLELWLEAIGNAARAETLAIAARYARHEDPALRVAAIAAVRLVADAAALELVESLAVHDADPFVRMRAVETLAARSEARALFGLARALGDQDQDVRCAAVVGLGARAEVSTWRPWLERAMAQDPALVVRDAAREILAQWNDPSR